MITHTTARLTSVLEWLLRQVDEDWFHSIVFRKSAPESFDPADFSLYEQHIAFQVNMFTGYTPEDLGAIFLAEIPGAEVRSIDGSLFVHGSVERGGDVRWAIHCGTSFAYRQMTPMTERKAV